MSTITLVLIICLFILIVLSGFLSGSETALTATSKPRILLKLKKGNKRAEYVLKILNNLDNVIAIEDRKEAIIHASKLLKDKDCLVILGKGHEVTQEINGKISHFSDHEVINEIYN